MRISTSTTDERCPDRPDGAAVAAFLFPWLAVLVVGAVGMVGVGAVGPGVADAAAVAAGEIAPADHTGAATFTLRELHDGEVASARFAAFWEAELHRIRTAPCPAPAGPGTTVVVATVGATPPAHLGDDFTDYAPLLVEARADTAAAC